MTVHVLVAGGTITSHLDDGEWRNLSGRELLDELGTPYASLVVDDVASGPSSNLSGIDMVSIARRVEGCFADGATGVVVVHGTDTMDLSAFTAHLLLGGAGALGAVVFTGSMRVHSHPHPDGPGNLRDAVAVAGDPAARGVSVCMNGSVHAAPFVNKRTAAAVEAFDSFPFRPVGAVVDGRFVATVGQAWPAGPRATEFVDDVGFVSCHPGVDASVITRAAAGRRGLVVEGFGDLNLPQVAWVPILEAGEQGLLVVIASRAFTPTSASGGMESIGVVGAGGLSAHKAVLLAQAALGSAQDREQAIGFVRGHALSFDAGTGGVR